jgi:polyphosphate:AMP phosphotransferase
LNRLRDELLDLQLQLRQQSQSAVALIVTGAPAAGRSETINELLSWLDPKHIYVHAFGECDEAERHRPKMWRYWQKLPARGRMAFFFAGWYADLASSSKTKRKRDPRAIQRVMRLEQMLVKERVHLVKVHLQVDRAVQKARLVSLQANKLTRWRVTDEDRWFAKHYARARRMAARYVEATSQPDAPWHVIDGSAEDQRLFDVGSLLAATLRAALTKSEPGAPATQTKPGRVKAQKSAPAPKNADMPTMAPAAELDDEQYERELESLQGRLALLVRRARFRKHALVLAFEGMDAAGKGGAIRRITHALDARQYQVVPISAPTQEEAAHPYLWRFWRHIPERGEITIFDRSWYGRVLVERVRQFTAPSDWERAYTEIPEFEQQLTEYGIIVAKFWLSVSKQEQLERFEKREQDPLKRFKVDEEDWKNRELYDAYQQAAAEMIAQTHRPDAPWFIVDADQKKHARLEVLRATCGEIERRLG